MLLGAANTPSSIPYAQAILGQNEIEIPDWLDRWEWGAHLILARNGDKDSIRYVIDRITSRPNWVLNRGLTRDLNYLHQPEVIEAYLEVLFSDEEASFIIPNHPLPFATQAMLHMSRQLENYPGGPIAGVLQWRTWEAVEEARDWALAQEGSWKIRDQRHTLRSEEWKLANLPGYGEEEAKPEEIVEEEEDREPEQEQDENSFAERAPALEPKQPEVDEEAPGGSVWPWLIMVFLVVFGGGVFFISRRKR